jgi:hypothetical protein
LERNYSVIKSLIYIVYIDLFSDMLSCVIKMYANDAKIPSRIQKGHVEQDTEHMKKYIDQFVGLTLNKCDSAN